MHIICTCVCLFIAKTFIGKPQTIISRSFIHVSFGFIGTRSNPPHRCIPSYALEFGGIRRAPIRLDRYGVCLFRRLSLSVTYTYVYRYPLHDAIGRTFITNLPNTLWLPVCAFQRRERVNYYYHEALSVAFRKFLANLKSEYSNQNGGKKIRARNVQPRQKLLHVTNIQDESELLFIPRNCEHVVTNSATLFDAFNRPFNPYRAIKSLSVHQSPEKLLFRGPSASNDAFGNTIRTNTCHSNADQFSLPPENCSFIRSQRNKLFQVTVVATAPFRSVCRGI